MTHQYMNDEELCVAIVIGTQFEYLRYQVNPKMHTVLERFAWSMWACSREECLSAYENFEWLLTPEQIIAYKEALTWTYCDHDKGYISMMCKYCMGSYFPWHLSRHKLAAITSSCGCPVNIIVCNNCLKRSEKAINQCMMKL